MWEWREESYATEEWEQQDSYSNSNQVETSFWHDCDYHTHGVCLVDPVGWGGGGSCCWGRRGVPVGECSYGAGGVEVGAGRCDDLHLLLLHEIEEFSPG